MSVHADIPAFPAFIRSEFLRDMDSAFSGQTEPCTVYAISSYQGHYPTFKVLLKNGALFDYIPIHALRRDREESIRPLNASSLYFKKTCPDNEIQAIRHERLASKFFYVACWLESSQEWRAVHEYICSVDWYAANQSAHLVALASGQFALVPNHKILFLQDAVDKLELPAYKKMRIEWKP